ncbi:MAG TPA: transglycosylase family protein [Acidimicrobiales bacterium]|nr:transglycosylase family protein [Acidimicrobiales bacterium]
MKKCLCFAAVTAGTMLGGIGVASAQEAPAPAGRSPVRPHTVAAGESLSKISLAELGSTDRWVEIFGLNRDTLATPDVIQVGQVLEVPSTTAAAPAVAPVQEPSPPTDQPPAQPHTVATGESLSGISLAELGTSERWVEIFSVNRSTIERPDLLHVGQVLEIPSVPVAVPADLLASLTTASAPVPSVSGRSVTTAAQEPTPTRALPSSGGGGGNLAAIRACESGGNYAAVSPGGLYRGAYQFDLPTWQSVGGSGDPAAASPAEQDARASQLRSQRGSNPWPNCG